MDAIMTFQILASCKTLLTVVFEMLCYGLINDTHIENSFLYWFALIRFLTSMRCQIACIATLVGFIFVLFVF